MNNKNIKASTEVVERVPRRTAYLPVKLKKIRNLNLFMLDAQVVDLSAYGAKVQCGRDVSALEGNQIWIQIPLLKAQANGETDIILRAECRWYNEEALALGLFFVDVSDEVRALLEGLVADLKDAGRLAC